MIVISKMNTHEHALLGKTQLHNLRALLRESEYKFHTQYLYVPNRAGVLPRAKRSYLTTRSLSLSSTSRQRVTRSPISRSEEMRPSKWIKSKVG